MSGRTFASPLFLGFDHLEQMLERASKTSSDGYPPYNIEQTGPVGLRITLAVAGFTMDDLQITQEDNQLVIRGRQSDDAAGRVFLHRGIAARQFQRAFVLAEGIDVRGAWMDNGLLHIDLARPQPEVRVKTIRITKSGQNGHGQNAVVQNGVTQNGSGQPGSGQIGTNAIGIANQLVDGTTEK
jgi:HSP20 family molecular chaperone IbpA